MTSMTDNLATRRALLDRISDETGAGKYAGPGLLLFCPDDRTTRDLAIAGRAASVTRPDRDDGPDHDALVGSGILRILGLGGRVTATLGQVPEDARLPEGAVCAFHPDCPTESPLREAAKAWVARASADPVRVPTLHLFGSRADYDRAVSEGVLSADVPMTGDFDLVDNDANGQTRALIQDLSRLSEIEGDRAIIDNAILCLSLSVFTDGVPSPVIEIHGTLREHTERKIVELDLEMTHVIRRHPGATLEEAPSP